MGKGLPIIAILGVVGVIAAVVVFKCKIPVVKNYLCKGGPQTSPITLPGGGTGTAINFSPGISAREDIEANRINPNAPTAAHFEMLGKGGASMPGGGPTRLSGLAKVHGMRR
jgi:hypothetical protein